MMLFNVSFIRKGLLYLKDQNLNNKKPGLMYGFNKRSTLAGIYFIGFIFDGFS